MGSSNESPLSLPRVLQSPAGQHGRGGAVGEAVPLCWVWWTLVLATDTPTLSWESLRQLVPCPGAGSRLSLRRSPTQRAPGRRVFQKCNSPQLIPQMLWSPHTLKEHASPQQLMGGGHPVAFPARVLQLRQGSLRDSMGMSGPPGETECLEPFSGASRSKLPMTRVLSEHPLHLALRMKE